jgi:hypothetical protein
MSPSVDVRGARLVAGVNVPDSPLIAGALEYARKLYEPYLFNHAVRSWLFAEAIGRLKGIDFDREVVAIARCSMTSASRRACQVPIGSR